MKTIEDLESYDGDCKQCSDEFGGKYNYTPSVSIKELKQSASDDLTDINKKISKIKWVRIFKDDDEYLKAFSLKITGEYIIKKFNLEKKTRRK